MTQLTQWWKPMLLVGMITGSLNQAAFLHPGLLHTRQDLERMQNKVQQGMEPWLSGFAKLRHHPHSSAQWQLLGAYETVSRGAGENSHNTELWQDGNAAYQNALMWVVTQDQAHAQKAAEILNAWSSTLKEIVGHDRHLAAGLYGFKLANAAEILRATYPAWTEKDIAQCRTMFKQVFYPVIKDFATFANGNWDGACIKMMMAIGVFCDDSAIFERAVDYYYHGSGNGRISHYVINEDGQCQESGRDQQHAQLGLGLLAEACEIGWHQGRDMYGAVDNRLLKGFEYTARYNLGHDVPFTPTVDTTGKYQHEAISDKGRGRLRAIFEMVFHHYAHRRGLAAPYTQQAAERIRPEGEGFQADHPGFGTLLFTRPSVSDDPRTVVSPDGRVRIAFTLQAGGVPAYKVDYLDQPIVHESRLGLEPDFLDGFNVTGTSKRDYANQWTQDLGERRVIPDQFHELTVDLVHTSGDKLRLRFRAYNEGAAWRYELPEQSTAAFVFSGERTEFRFPENTYGYEAHGTEGEYQRVLTNDIEPWCERPLTVEYAHGLYACLYEAANTNYPRMLLSPSPDAPGALVSALGGRTSNTDRPNQRHDPTARLNAGDVTPWRLLVVGQTPGDLLERNYLVLNLNPPTALEDSSWIKPGKVMRDTTLTTENAKAVIDFAATGGLQYAHLDAGWYGSEDAQSGDATTGRRPDLDVEEILRYGEEKGVGLILYVDRRQIRSQRDVLFPLYEQWGIKGIKIGFAKVGPQEETAWIAETIQKAAEHHLMLNIHDGYRATGENRTYPNLMTVEGIRGNEHMPTPAHNCTLPFTRYIGGIGDYTVCYMDRRIKTTHAHQLAMAVVLFSPLQWIYWYDRPDMLNNEPELEWFRRVPTVWDDTKVINGAIGKYAAIARRNGNDWFVGTINNSEERTLTVPLSFLTEDTAYTAHIYADDDTVETRTKVGITTRTVDAQTVLEVSLTSGGGQAIWITPER